MSGFGLNPSFNEPPTPDTTSATPLPDQQPGIQPQINPLQAALTQNRKKKQSLRPPGPLARQIGRAKLARQKGEKYG